MIADTVKPVTGSVDKTSQRVALKIQGNDKAIIESGLYNSGRRTESACETTA